MVRASRGWLAPLGSLLFLLAATPVSAQCVGDCAADGEVTINDLILGVNIALDNAPVSACPAFANEMDQVNIAQLIKGVNNALNGCPEPVATATSTTGVAATPTNTSPAATATATASAVPPTATATSVATSTSVATATATGVPTGTATAVSTATATGVATTTATAVATATATGVATASATSPVAASATATPPATATNTVPPTPPHTAVATATATATVTAPSTATATNTVPPTVSATATQTATPTETAVPPGQAVGGRAAYMSAGLGGIQALVAAVVTAVTNDGGVAIVAGGLPPPIETDQCSISGETTQSCVEMGMDASKTIHLVLGANQCVVPGPLGGTGEFDGSITVDSNPSGINQCSPIRFLSGAYDVTNLTVILRDSMDIGTTVAADLDGDVAITGVSQSCVVGSLSLSVNGTLRSTLPDGSGVEVDFFDTAVTMTAITYNGDCVPLIYTLTFNGDAAFTPIAALPPALTNGLPAEPSFDVAFVNFVMKQNATTTPVTVEMDGTIMSGCLGGQFVMDTLAPMAIAAGQLCPNAGQVTVTGSGNSKATVTYQSDMSVTVTPMGGQPTNYPSCLVEELQMCVPA